MKTEMNIAEMTVEDYDEVLLLWQNVKGMGLDEQSDSKKGIANYLHRNPGLSFIARSNGSVVGAVLGGHDGRRGYLHHLAVDNSYQKKGVGKLLVERVIGRLRSLGIHMCHLFVFCSNKDAQEFWRKIGWKERLDLKVMSKDISWENRDDS